MKKINTILILVSLIFVLVAGCATQPTYVGTAKEPQVEQPSAPEKGRVVFTITDAAADMDSITSVKVTIDSVKVHSATEGWLTVSSTPRTYDLLKLKAEGKQELMADVELKEGTYNQIRLDISNVVVTDAQGEHEAKIPSGELKIIGELVVEANSTSTATFDFMADESLHVTGKGEYIMAPVVQLETREDADVEVKSDSKVEIKSGKVKTKVEVGMDIEGNVGVGLKIGKNANLSIDMGVVKIGGKSSTNIGIGIGKQEE